MNILITGASSFTGCWFAAALAESGADITATLLGTRDSYSGLRAERVAQVAEHAKVIEECPFGSERFVSLIERGSFDVLCHHAARVTDYRSPDFDVVGALADNTRNIRTVLERFAGRGGKAVVLTGSVFESREGAGTMPLKAFSPYGVSKALTAEMFGYWTNAHNLPLGKFVIANPFGPLEEPRFCSYLVRSWMKGETPEVRTPLYVRDNIHVSLLAKAYAAFVSEMASDPKSRHYAPTGYIESQEMFARRFASEMGPRLGMDCPVATSIQTDFSEPLVRVNTDLVRLDQNAWDEASAWDQIGRFYKPTI